MNIILFLLKRKYVLDKVEFDTDSAFLEEATPIFSIYMKTLELFSQWDLGLFIGRYPLRGRGGGSNQGRTCYGLAPLRTG